MKNSNGSYKSQAGSDGTIYRGQEMALDTNGGVEIVKYG